MATAKDIAAKIADRIDSLPLDGASHQPLLIGRRVGGDGVTAEASEDVQARSLQAC